MGIEYKTNITLELNQVIDLFKASSLGERRPVGDRDRMALMLKHANLTISAWDGELLVGLSRSFSDFSFVTYLSDLVVRESHQRLGIGKILIQKTQEEGGINATLVLTAAPDAEKYYPHIGFVHIPQCWALPSQEKLPHYQNISATTRRHWKLL